MLRSLGLTETATGRPIAGRLVVRSHSRPAAAHRAWRYGAQVFTHCGRTFPARASKHRVWVESVDLVPISCKHCLRV